MSLNLDRLQARDKYFADGKPTMQMQLFWQKFAKAIEDAFNANEALDEAQQQLIEDVQTALLVALGTANDLGTTNDFIRTRDSAVDGLTIDAGTSSITVSTHDRQYLDPSQTVSVTGDTITGLSSSTTYFIHYTDTDYSGGTVGYQAATALQDASPTPSEPYRHYVGTIEVPAAGTASGTPAPDPTWKQVTATGGGTGDLLSTNNLSDVANAATALSNLGGQPLDSDLTAIAALTTTAYGRSLLEAANASALRTLAGTVIGTDVQAYDADLAALASNGTNGIWAHTGAGTGAARTITGTAGLITVTNGDGVSGNPTITRAFSGAMVKKAADQTGANYSAGVTVAWDEEVYDTDSYHDSVTNNTRLTAPVTGKYQAAYEFQVAGLTANEYLRALIMKNGTNAWVGRASQFSGSAATPPFISGVTPPVDLTAGDYLEAWLDTQTDTSIDVVSTVSFFAMWRVA